MNEMYNMALSLHSWSAGAVFVVIFINLYILISAKELAKYKRVNSLYLLPLVITVLGALLFTGIVMMAAKHLHFSIENIVMIILGVVLIVLEAKHDYFRSSSYSVRSKAFESFEISQYKKRACFRGL